MSATQKKLPVLRFRDENGRDYPEWRAVRLDEIKSKAKHSLTGGPFGSDLKKEDFRSTGVRIIQLQNIGDGKFIDEHKVFTSKQKADQLKNCNIFSGEIIISKMGDPVARACIIPATGDNRHLMASDGIRLSVDKKRFDFKFIHDSINYVSFRKIAIARSTGSTRKRIGLSDLRQLKIHVPTFKEQQKIALFLSSVDTRIEQLSRKKELLEQYRKGLMQKLFSQELRFRDENGRDYPKWEERKLGDISRIFKGSGLSKSTVRRFGKFPCILYGELFTKYGEIIETIFSFTDEDVPIASRSGDILMPTSDVTPQGLATASVVLIDGVKLGGDINVIRVDSRINSIFMCYQINFWKKKILILVTGTTVMHIYAKDIRKIIYRVPSSRKEQQKIADLLSSIDKKIELVAQQIDKARLFKKGLLQQMFV